MAGQVMASYIRDIYNPILIMIIPCFIVEGEDKNARLRSSQFYAQIICAKIIKTKLDHARNFIELFSSKTKKYNRGTKRKGNSQQKKSRIINIPPNHPYTNIWNMFTIFLTFISTYTTHNSIRYYRYGFTIFTIFTGA